MKHQISTHTPLAGRDLQHRLDLRGHVISTHTPLAGRDVRLTSVRLEIKNFNSHAPRGARRTSALRLPSSRRFQLTRPSRGATPSASKLRPNSEFQLTRPSRGATADQKKWTEKIAISTHTPLAGRDCVYDLLDLARPDFNSHAPRGARHSVMRSSTALIRHFNSHAPRGARPDRPSCSVFRREFQLTRPSRGATLLSPHCTP